MKSRKPYPVCWEMRWQQSHPVNPPLVVKGRIIMKTTLTFTAVLLFCFSSLPAQTTGLSEPGGRNKPGFVYDSARKKFVLFGGFGNRGEGIKSDTWLWDRSKWKQASTSGPS